MKKTLTTGFMMVLSTTLLSACGGARSLATLSDNSSTFSALSFDSQDNDANQKDCHHNNDKKMGHPKGPGPGFIFGMLSELNLSETQKAEIQSLMKAEHANRPERPAPPDAAAIQAVQAKISTAFVSDRFDADSLHAEMKSIHDAVGERPDPVVMELAHAQHTLNVWNILTTEQRATLSTKVAALSSEMAEREAKRPEKTGKGPEHMLAQLSQKLTLSTAQQAALNTVFEAHKPPAHIKPDPQVLITLLNSGSATAASIAALHPRPEKVEHNPLSILESLHDVLSTEQRQRFADSGLLKPSGHHGGPGRHGGGHP